MSAERDTVFEGPMALAARVRAREVHPRELVEVCLRRIETLDPRLNAFRVTMADEALAAAEGPLEGPLAGVPVAIKDDAGVLGQPRTQGSRSFGPPEATDDEFVRRLRAAGAIPIGITRVPELMIFPWTVSAAGGITRNPWDPSRTTGGSSGGSGAAVAAGMVPCATGSDGGGSIRIPAAACGLVGMKPTRGRVSNQPRGEGWFGLSVYGGLARTVRDSALMLDAMHGLIGGEQPAAPPFSGSYLEAAGRPPERLRIAVSRKIAAGQVTRLSEDQHAAWHRMIGLLQGLGHDVIERDPDYGLAMLEFTQLWLRGIYEQSLEVPERERLEPLTRQMTSLGRYLVPPRRRDALLARRERTSRRIMALWEDCDVLMTPGLAKTAIPAEGAYGKPAPLAIDAAARLTPYTALFNLTGQPAMTLPAGIGSDGLPLSIQLVGRRGAEELLYSLGGQLEDAQPWADRRPPVS